jgi:hypothetical protein
VNRSAIPIADGSTVGVNYSFANRPFTAGTTPNQTLQSNQTSVGKTEIEQ